MLKLPGKKEKLKILFVTSEEFPFVKVGGLGEVMFSLPRALNRLGCDARVFMPKYGSIESELLAKRSYVYEGLTVPIDPDRVVKDLVCNVLRVDSMGDSTSPVTTYLLENQEYYELRSNVYGYSDDRVRFALLSRGCLEFLNATNDWKPNVIVATDWMAGYLPNFLKVEYKDYVYLKDIATVFSIHNIYSQGPSRRFRFIPQTELDDGYGALPDFFSERMQNINAMKRGIIYADVINTVSPTYAKEITTPEFGEGLDTLLFENRGKLEGILNGVDYETKNPATDSAIFERYDVKSLDKRADNKIALQKRLGLPEIPGVFMVGAISRLSRQKGFALFDPIIDDFINVTGCQVIVVGTGDTEIMDFFANLQKKFPDNVRAHLQYDPALPQNIYSGADTIVIPSQFEPCGLTQMEAMRYGAIPVARRTGGLADTITDFNPADGSGTGFLFDEPKPVPLLIALTRAYVNWRHKASWRKLQERVMKTDFSWDRSAKEYLKLFEKAIRIKKGDPSSNGANIPPAAY